MFLKKKRYTEGFGGRRLRHHGERGALRDGRGARGSRRAARDEARAALERAHAHERAPAEPHGRSFGAPLDRCRGHVPPLQSDGRGGGRSAHDDSFSRLVPRAHPIRTIVCFPMPSSGLDRASHPSGLPGPFLTIQRNLSTELWTRKGRRHRGERLQLQLRLRVGNSVGNSAWNSKAFEEDRGFSKKKAKNPKAKNGRLVFSKAALSVLTLRCGLPSLWSNPTFVSTLCFQNPT